MTCSLSVNPAGSIASASAANPRSVAIATSSVARLSSSQAATKR